MVTKRSVLALAFFCTVTLAMSAHAVAQEPWIEVRRALYGDCERFTGHAKGICMSAKAQTMKNWSEESRENYKDCLEEGNSGSFCDQKREEFWQEKLAS